MIPVRCGHCGKRHSHWKVQYWCFGKNMQMSFIWRMRCLLHGIWFSLVTVNWKCVLLGHKEYVEVEWEKTRPHDHPVYVKYVFLICKRCGNLREGTIWDLGYQGIGD